MPSNPPVNLAWPCGRADMPSNLSVILHGHVVELDLITCPAILHWMYLGHVVEKANLHALQSSYRSSMAMW